MNEYHGEFSRFEWPKGGKGFDCNTAFTINDIWGSISWVWTYPGDYFLNLDPVQVFLDMPKETVIGSTWSTVLGFVLVIFWFSRQ